MKAVYSGSFDPVTLGHIDIVKRASGMFEELIVGVLRNASKTPMFTVEEREEMLREAFSGLPNVRVTSFSGLSVDFARQEGASVILRGIRSADDLSYESVLANGNRAMRPELDTVFLLSDPALSFVNSSHAKEIAYYGGELSAYVPPFVENKIKEKLMETKK